MSKAKKFIYGAKEAAELAHSLIKEPHKNKEHFIGIYLNCRNKAIYEEVISVGTLNTSLCHPRETFRPALVRSAASVITIHNHPSSNLEPSEADLTMNERLKKAGEILGIELLDNIIINDQKEFYSFKEHKIL